VDVNKQKSNKRKNETRKCGAPHIGESGFVGVWRSSQDRRKWTGEVRWSGKRYGLSTYATAEEANADWNRILAEVGMGHLAGG
jgi:hypothetical protein